MLWKLCSLKINKLTSKKSSHCPYGKMLWSVHARTSLHHSYFRRMLDPVVYLVHSFRSSPSFLASFRLLLFMHPLFKVNESYLIILDSRLGLNQYGKSLPYRQSIQMAVQEILLLTRTSIFVSLSSCNNVLRPSDVATRHQRALPVFLTTVPVHFAFLLGDRSTDLFRAC